MRQRMADPGPAGVQPHPESSPGIDSAALCWAEMHCGKGTCIPLANSSLVHESRPDGAIYTARFSQPHANFVRLTVRDQEHHHLSTPTKCSPSHWRHASQLQEHQHRGPPLTDIARTPRECNRPTSLVAVVDVCYRCKDSKAATSCKGTACSENEPAMDNHAHVTVAS